MPQDGYSAFQWSPERCVTDPFPDLALVHMFSRTVTCIRILCRKIPVPGNSDTDTFQFNILRFVLSDVTRPVCSVELCEGLHTQTHAYDTFYDTFYQAGILSSVSKISETVSVVRKVCSFCRVFYFTSSSRLSSFDFWTFLCKFRYPYLFIIDCFNPWERFRDDEEIHSRNFRSCGFWCGLGGRRLVSIVRVQTEERCQHGPTRTCPLIWKNISIQPRINWCPCCCGGVALQSLSWSDMGNSASKSDLCGVRGATRLVSMQFISSSLEFQVPWDL